MRANGDFLRAGARQFWGEVQRSRTMTPGVLWCSTAGHGGVVVDPAVYPLHPALREGLDGNVATWLNGFTLVECNRIVGFEEDCSWAVLFAVHQDLIPLAIKTGWIAKDATVEYITQQALDTVQRWHPEMLPLIQGGAS